MSKLEQIEDADRAFHILVGAAGAVWMQELLPSHTIWLPICMTAIMTAAGVHHYRLVKKEKAVPKRKFEIWSEGYQITGDRRFACKLGESFGKDLKDACCRFAATNEAFADKFDPTNMTYWECRLFDNEDDARKAFG